MGTSSTRLVESMHSRAGSRAAITSREDSAMTKDRKGVKRQMDEGAPQSATDDFARLDLSRDEGRYKIPRRSPMRSGGHAEAGIGAIRPAGNRKSQTLGEGAGEEPRGPLRREAARTGETTTSGAGG